MKSLINTALLKEQLKRFWSVGALALLAYVLLILLPVYKPANQVYELRNQINQLIELLRMRNIILLFASVLTPLTAALTLFTYLFSSKATTAVHALPLNKKQLFFTNAAAGILLIAAPLLILCGFLLIPIPYPSPDLAINGILFSEYTHISFPVALFPQGLNPCDTINTLPVVAGFFARALMTQVFYFAVFLLAISLAGNVVVAILCAGALPLIPAGLCMLLLLIGKFYVFGFSTISMEFLLEKTFIYTNPFMLAVHYEYPYFTPGEPFTATALDPVWPLLTVYALTALFLFALACLFIHKRRQERAGESIVFTPFKNVLIFGLSVLGMLLMGIFLMGMMNSVTALYVGFGLGFVLAYFIAQMIAEKAVNVLHKAKDILLYGGIMLGLFVLLVTVTRLDLFGYAHYVPAESKVASVYLSSPYSYYYRNSDIPFFFIDDPDVIADTLSIHRDILYNQNELRKVYIDGLAGRPTEWGFTQDIMYLLKDGTTVARSYRVTEAFADSPGVNINGLQDNEQVILSVYHHLKKASLIDNILLEFYETATKQIHTVNVYLPDDMPSLLEAVRKDIVNSVRDGNARRREDIKKDAQVASTVEDKPLSELEDTEAYTSWYGAYTMPGDRNNSRWNIPLERHENTQAWLMNHGYFTFLEE